ncbi:hypothetical protein HDU98_009462 [Podochytrium sp. JEL0797]|nr:hypothetical protein HDU98_009462 [Podochytrium sp. JEL0797]
MDQITHTLSCPISWDPFTDPVLLPDGHTYERTNITAWFAKTPSSSYGMGTSPVTRQPMYAASMVPNLAVRNMSPHWVKVCGMMNEKDAQIKALEARVAELEANEGVSRVVRDGVLTGAAASASIRLPIRQPVRLPAELPAGTGDAWKTKHDTLKREIKGAVTAYRKKKIARKELLSRMSKIL